MPDLRIPTLPVIVALVAVALVLPGFSMAIGPSLSVPALNDEVRLADLVAAPKVGSKLDPGLRPLIAADSAAIDVIIQYVDAPTDADAAALLAAGFVPPFISFGVVPAIATAGSAYAIRAILSDPRVVYVEEDVVIPYALDRAAEATRTKPVWDAVYEKAGVVHDNGITGRGIGIAIVDTGVDATIPDLLWKPLADATGLPAKTLVNVKLVGRTSVLNYNDDNPNVQLIAANTLGIDMPNTDNTGGHGTHVAGTAAGTGAASDGKYKGAAPGANLIGFGAGEVLVASMGLAAFDWIWNNKDDEDLNIRIVSNSWGGAGDWNPNSSVTRAAQKLAIDAGMVVVFAAGNDGGDGSSIRTSVWANIPEVLSIGNYDDRTGWMARTSSRGLATLERTWPDVSAPGTNIVATAATGGPVSYYGTGADSLISILDQRGEEHVVPTPIPVSAEVDALGTQIVVGPYGSMSGTSMATPFVSGVIALMLEANPTLNPEEVRSILRATANAPPGRAYATDGHAMGAGIVNAAYAVAVALRMADGMSLADALRFAVANVDSSPAGLNTDAPRHLDIAVAEGAELEQGEVTIDVGFLAGSVTDRTIPLHPGTPSPIVGAGQVYHGGLNPFGLTGGNHMLPGETVTLAVRTLRSTTETINLSTGFTATHTITKNGAVAYGPFDAQVRADGADFRTDTVWSVPLDATFGNYVFEATVTMNATGDSYPAARVPFTIGSSARLAGIPSTELPPVVATTVFFEEGFEDDVSGWTITQEGFLHGLATEWVLIEEEFSWVTWSGLPDGNAFWAGAWPGAPTTSGHQYTDFADTSLISPAIGLDGASAAELSYMRAGSSEDDWDFLEVHVAVDGTDDWTLVDSVSGASTSWEERIVDLSVFAGETIRLRFRFVSDAFSFEPNLGGWYVDSIVVRGETGSPALTVTPSFTASNTFGVDELRVHFRFDALASAEITGFRLDFGDGSAEHVTTKGGQANHTYAAGEHMATLTVETLLGSKSFTIPIDVAPSGVVQLRVNGGSWTTLGAALLSDDSFPATLDLSGEPLGAATLETRHYDGLKRGIFHAVNVVIVEAELEP